MRQASVALFIVAIVILVLLATGALGDDPPGVLDENGAESVPGKAVDGDQFEVESGSAAPGNAMPDTAEARIESESRADDIVTDPASAVGAAP